MHNQQIYYYEINSKEEFRRIDCRDLIYCEADGRYSILHLRNGADYMQSKTLKRFMDEVNCPWFIRLGQSVAVNRLYIEKVIYKERQIVLTTGKIFKFTLKVKEIRDILRLENVIFRRK